MRNVLFLASYLSLSPFFSFYLITSSDFAFEFIYMISKKKRKDHQKKEEEEKKYQIKTREHQKWFQANFSDRSDKLLSTDRKKSEEEDI